MGVVYSTFGNRRPEVNQTHAVQQGTSVASYHALSMPLGVVHLTSPWGFIEEFLLVTLLVTSPPTCFFSSDVVGPLIGIFIQQISLSINYVPRMGVGIEDSIMKE